MQAVTDQSPEIPSCKEMVVITESYVEIPTATPQLNINGVTEPKLAMVPELEVPVIPNLYLEATIDQMMKIHGSKKILAGIPEPEITVNISDRKVTVAEILKPDKAAVRPGTGLIVGNT